MPTKPTPTITIGQCLLRARKQAGLTQVQAAELTGFTQARISQWETQTDNVQLSTLAAFARAYGLTVSELLEGY